MPLSTHGHARKGHMTPEYKTWQSMIQRCRNPRIKGYHRWGGRGISVCKRWQNSFQNFLDDMGVRPPGAMSIDRIDNDGHYEPGNTRWASRQIQNQNSCRTRLSLSAVRTIRVLYAAGLRPKKLAQEFGVTQGAICYAIQIIGWKNAEGPVVRAMVRDMSSRRGGGVPRPAFRPAHGLP